MEAGKRGLEPGSHARAAIEVVACYIGQSFPALPRPRRVCSRAGRAEAKRLPRTWVPQLGRVWLKMRCQFKSTPREQQSHETATPYRRLQPCGLGSLGVGFDREDAGILGSRIAGFYYPMANAGPQEVSCGPNMPREPFDEPMQWGQSPCMVPRSSCWTRRTRRRGRGVACRHFLVLTCTGTAARQNPN